MSFVVDADCATGTGRRTELSTPTVPSGTGRRGTGQRHAGVEAPRPLAVALQATPAHAGFEHRSAKQLRPVLAELVRGEEGAQLIALLAAARGAALHLGILKRNRTGALGPGPIHGHTVPKWGKELQPTEPPRHPPWGDGMMGHFY